MGRDLNFVIKMSRKIPKEGETWLYNSQCAFRTIICETITNEILPNCMSWIMSSVQKQHSSAGQALGVRTVSIDNCSLNMRRDIRSGSLLLGCRKIKCMCVKGAAYDAPCTCAGARCSSSKLFFFLPVSQLEALNKSGSRLMTIT